MSGFYGYARIGDRVFRERFGLDFEDFAVGQVFNHRPGVTVTQQDNADEALDTINNAHLHYDLHYALATEWKNNLGVSTMTLQRLIGMSSRTFYRRRRFVGFHGIAMTRPVFGGDTLYARSRITSCVDGDDADTGLVGVTLEGVNQTGAIIATVEYRAEVYRRGRHPEALADARSMQVAEEPRFRLFHPAEDGSLIEQCGLYYEDFVAGETFEHWPPKTISVQESASHALRSLEINPRYADASYAKSVLGGDMAIFEPFVLGTLTALTTRTFGRVVANLGWTDVEMPRQVKPGESLRAVSVISAKRESARRPAQGIVQAVSTMHGEDGAVVCRFHRAFLIYKAGVGPYAAAGY